MGSGRGGSCRAGRGPARGEASGSRSLEAGLGQEGPAPRAGRPAGTAESRTTSVPQCPQLSGRATPGPPALRHRRQEAEPSPELGLADALPAERGESVQHSGGKGDGVAQQRGQGQADDDRNDGHPGGEAEVKGRSRPAASGPPRFTPAPFPAGRDPQRSAGAQARPRFATPSNTRKRVCQILCIFRGGGPKLSPGF